MVCLYLGKFKSRATFEMGTWASPFVAKVGTWCCMFMEILLCQEPCWTFSKINMSIPYIVDWKILNVFHRLTSWFSHFFLKGGTNKSTFRARHLSVQGADSKLWERKRSTYPPHVACGQDALSSILFKWWYCKERIQNIAQIPDLINSISWNDLINPWGFGGMIL